MTDEEALRALAVGYAAAVDTLDGPAFAALFCEDGELWVPDTSRGPEPTVCRSGASLGAIPGALARYHSTCHAVWSVGYSVDVDEATGEIRGVAHHFGAAGGDQVARPFGPGTDTIWYLRYVDAYRRTPDGWRIARRALHLRDLEVRTVRVLGPGR